MRRTIWENKALQKELEIIITIYDECDDTEKLLSLIDDFEYFDYMGEHEFVSNFLILKFDLKTHSVHIALKNQSFKKEIIFNRVICDYKTLKSNITFLMHNINYLEILEL